MVITARMSPSETTGFRYSGDSWMLEGGGMSGVSWIAEITGTEAAELVSWVSTIS